MPKYRVTGMIEVGVSYLVEAEDADAAMEVEVNPHVVALDATGQGLGMLGALYGSVMFHTSGCLPELDEVNLDGAS